jgi:Dolichyl-phosphate-mannose-protein mannosyltransferase
MSSKFRLGPGAVGAIVFTLLGLCFVNRAGIATDEAALEATLFRDWRFFSVPLFHHNVPVMELTYIGELKTWLYSPIFLIWNPTAASVRFPAILMGALTVLLFAGLLQRVHGPRAAWVGSILLATDVTFLLTTVHDWGPVVLQHLLLAAVMLLAVRWFQTSGSMSLIAAAFCCGLAFWDKAVFLWIFSGLMVGCLLYAREIRARLTRRTVAIAAFALCVGALPLIVYNLAGPEKFATVKGNLHRSNGLSSVWFVYKLRQLEAAWDGSSLFGYLVNEDAGPRPGSADSLLEHASFAVHGFTGDHRRSLMTLALLVALLLVPLLWRTSARRALLFGVIAIVVAWLHMALAGGGGAAHHAVLLWPLPHLFLAIALAEASLRVPFGKWALAVVTGLLMIGNILVMNQYLYQFIRNGEPVTWTDAVYPLAEDLKRSHASQILLPDWGITDALCVLTRDTPPTHTVEEPFAISDTNAIWVDHAPDQEFLKGIHERVVAAGRHAGFKPVMLKTYFDRNGRAMFQSYKFKYSH